MHAIFQILQLLITILDMGSIQLQNWNCWTILELLIFQELELNLELKFATKKLNLQINLPFNFLIQKYFFHDNLTWNINYLE